MLRAGRLLRMAARVVLERMVVVWRDAAYVMANALVQGFMLAAAMSFAV